jgi:beta-fructofuranosidase
MRVDSGDIVLKINRRKFLVGGAAVIGAPTLRMVAFSGRPSAPSLPLDLAADPRRPQYHLLPPANWTNDPNGPIYWRGEYHMFYQYNPDGAYWGDMHWGHAVSSDMVHWRHLPVALAPTPGGPDSAGCFSGTALAVGNEVVLLYTGVVSAQENEATIRNGAHSLRESQCLATGTGKDLTVWTKDPMPVIVAPPAGMDVTGFRDPAPWRQGDNWYMAVGSGIRGKSAVVLLYRSTDLHHWEYLHVLAQGSGTGPQAGNPVESGDMWECPDFFPLGNKHVLIHSTGGKAYWQSGSLDPDAMVFHPERGGVLDYGSYYAPKTQVDKDGQRIVWGWILEARPESEFRAAGWAGMISLPRVLRLDADTGLQIELAPEVEKLREREQRLRITGNEESDRRQLAQMRVENACGEIVWTFRRGADPVEIALVSADNRKPWLACRYDPSHANEIAIDEQLVPCGAGEDRETELRFLIDGSVIECFANRHGALTKRFYYAGSSAPVIGVQVNGKLESLSGLSMWQIKPISRDRLTT